MVPTCDPSFADQSITVLEVPTVMSSLLAAGVRVADPMLAMLAPSPPGVPLNAWARACSGAIAAAAIATEAQDIISALGLILTCFETRDAKAEVIGNSKAEGGT
jgi:hypothetical protein